MKLVRLKIMKLFLNVNREEYDGRYYAEITATIEPNNGQCFSGYEFLMKVHIQTLNKDLGDDNFMKV